jgi:hypothetical protein
VLPWLELRGGTRLDAETLYCQHVRTFHSQLNVGANTTRSRLRARVEHGHQHTSMGGTIVRTIGIVRARAKIGLMNLVYNISRLVQLERMAAAPARAERVGGVRAASRKCPPRCRARRENGPEPASPKHNRCTPVLRQR